MKNLAFYNEKIDLIENMTVPFCDRVHFFGDGIYEVTLARNYNIYALHEHIDRFYKNADLLSINIKYKKDELANILKTLVHKLDSPDQHVYWQLTRGTENRSHTFSHDLIGNLWVMLRPGLPRDLSHKIRAITAPDTRHYHCNIKTLNLIPTVMYAQYAQSRNVYETILYRLGDRVTECSHSNIHIINREGIFQTAPADNLILAGIARGHLIEGCRYLGIDFIEKPFTVSEMMDAKEILISSSTAFCYICEQIDGINVGGGDTDKALILQQYVIKKFMDATDKE